MLFLLLACGDKDTDGTTGDSSVTTDSPVDTGDSDRPGDSDPQAECTLGAVSPLTVPIETEGTEVTVEFDCEPTRVTLAGEEVSFTIGGGNLIVLDAAELTLLGPSDIVLEVEDGTHTTSVRGHTAEPSIEQPSDLTLLDGDTLLHVGDESILTISGGDLVLTDTSTWKTTPVSMGLGSGVCQYGRCFLVASSRSAIGHEDGKVVWSDIDKGTLTWDLSGDIVAVDVSSVGPRALTRDPNKDLVTAHELSTGKSWEIAVLSGDVRLLDEVIVEASCEREKSLAFQDNRFSTAEMRSSVSSDLACEPTEWRVQLNDVDGDGNEDQVHILDYGDGPVIAVRLFEEKGWGAPQVVANIGGRSYTYSDTTGYVAQNSVRGTTTFSLGETESSTIAAENPIYAGIGGQHENAIDASRPSSGAPTVLRARDALYVRTGGWAMLSGLVRSKSDDGSMTFELDGVSVKGLPDGVAGVYDGTTAFFGTEDLVIDEREMTYGEDWDFDVTPFGPDLGGVVALAHVSEDGLGLSYLDVNDPADDAGRIRKRPDLLMSEWNDLLDEQLETLRENPLASMTPGDGSFTSTGEALDPFDSELMGPALVVTVPWDTGTECKLATVLLGGGEDVDTMWETAQVLSTGSDSSCSDLAVPLGSADLFGDGGYSVVMSDGTAYRVNEFQIPEKVVMEKDGDFYGLSAGDLNGDGLGDAVLYGADEATLWLSDGAGGSLAYEGDLPAWVWITYARGAGPGAGLSPVRLFSWGVVLD